MKKGVSPLIATVILIGFVIVLSAYLFTWEGKYIEEVIGSTEKMIHSSRLVNVEVSDLSYDASQITFKVENKDNIDISNFSLTVSGDLSTFSKTIPGIPKYSTKIYHIDYDFNEVGNINKITVTPITIEENNPVLNTGSSESESSGESRSLGITLYGFDNGIIWDIQNPIASHIYDALGNGLTNPPTASKYQITVDTDNPPVNLYIKADDHLETGSYDIIDISNENFTIYPDECPNSPSCTSLDMHKYVHVKTIEQETETIPLNFYLRIPEGYIRSGIYMNNVFFKVVPIIPGDEICDPYNECINGPTADCNCVDCPEWCTDQHISEICCIDETSDEFGCRFSKCSRDSQCGYGYYCRFPGTCAAYCAPSCSPLIMKKCIKELEQDFDRGEPAP